VRSLSVDEINRKLDQRFQLLTGGSRTALPRQQTLRSLIDWSYELLTDRERRLLQRLSVFVGGWTLEAAEQVCTCDDVADREILDLLTSLCDKSLVLVEQCDGSYRYRLLETVRQYARERLLAGGGAEAVRARHRDCFLALAEATHAKLKGPEQAMCLQRLEAEHENLRASLEWSLADGGLNAGLRLCGALQYFWIMRGHFSEGRRWCERILANAGADERTPERANAISAAGLMAYRQDDFAAARALLEESLAIRRQLGDRKSIGVAAGNLGMVALDEGDFASARALHEESLAIARELGNRNGVLASLANLGNANYEQGDIAAARALFEESLALSRELEDGHTTAMTLHRLGMIEGALGNHSVAEALYKESLTILRRLGLRGRIFYSLQALAAVAAALGSPLRAARIWGAEERLREEIGLKRSAAEMPLVDPQIRDARTVAGDAAAFERTWQEGRALPLEQAIEFALSSGHS
jgi:tetratricopeptide (TPR) repeat protein